MKKVLSQVRPGLRGKTAWITFLFLSAFLIFLLVYAIEFSQTALSTATEEQSDSLAHSLSGPIQQVADLDFENRILRKKMRALQTRKPKSASEDRRRSRELKKIREKIKKNEARIPEIIRSIRPSENVSWQIQVIDKNGQLRFHSSPSSLPPAVRNKIKRGLPVTLSLSEPSLKPVAKLIRSHKKMKTGAWKKIRKVQEEDGYLSVLYPLYARSSKVQEIRVLEESFLNDEIPKKELKELSAVQLQGKQLLRQLSEFVSTWKVAKPDDQFQVRYFYADKTAKSRYKEILKIQKEARKRLLRIHDTVSSNLDEKIAKLKVQIKNLTRKKQSTAYLLIELNKLQNKSALLKVAYRRFFSNVASVLYPESSGWEKLYGLLRITFSPIPESSSVAFSKAFYGVLETEIFLYDKLQASRRARNKMVDAGVALSMRALFLVFLMSSFFVKDIKRLASTALRVKQGDLNQTFSVSSKDELRDLAATFNEMLAGLREREQLRAEIETAAIIQKNLLPGEEVADLKDSISFAFAYRPMIGVGGDYVDLFPVSANKIFFLIADVSNHGVGPGLVMTMARSAVRSMAKAGLPLREIVLKLNEQLVADTPSNIFVTMLIGTLDPSSGSAEYISCGHNPPVLMKKDKCEFLPAGGMALGAMIPAIFDTSVQTHKTKLASGEFLVLYTDGLTEAENPKGVMYDDPRLLKLLDAIRAKGTRHPERIVKTMLKSLEQFTGIPLPSEGPTELSDDVAILVIGGTPS